MSEATNAIAAIRQVMGDRLPDLEPQDAVNVLAEIQSDCESSIDALKEEYGVEPE